MKFIQFAKYISNYLHTWSSQRDGSVLKKAKTIVYIVFLSILIFFFFAQHTPLFLSESMDKDKSMMDTYNILLNEKQQFKEGDSSIHHKEKVLLLSKINDKLVNYLFKSRDYNDINVLKPYFKYVPNLTKEIPGCVPLKQGNYWKSSDYGYRFHPIHKKTKKHYGVDFASPIGTKVYSTANGKVEKILHSNTGYGNHIIIRHRFGFKTIYGHLHKILVQQGQYVKAHELIGLVGSTGLSTGPHLHYEIVKNEKKIDPFPSCNLQFEVYKNLVATNQ